MIKKIIAIDPGASGGIAILAMDGMVIETSKMPESEIDLLNYLYNYQKDSFCYMERLHGMPGMSGVGMFHFGQNYGNIRMALVALKIPFEDITPQKWMKEFVLKKEKTETKTEWKNRLKAKAQQFFPNIKVTLAISDALLIGEYGRRCKK